MSESSQKPRITECKQRVHDILDQIRDIDDADLWEEAKSKLSDVLKVWRDAEKAKPEPTTVAFRDGETRHIDRLAFDAAYADAFSEWDGDDEFPAFMCRGERNA